MYTESESISAEEMPETWFWGPDLCGNDIIAYTLGEELRNERPIHSAKSNEPVKYHCIESCNACGGANEIISPSYEECHLIESKTKCLTCGHSDYWAYGFFESSQEIESKCQTYSFGEPIEGGE